jgi:hypothetical protein
MRWVPRKEKKSDDASNILHNLPFVLVFAVGSLFQVFEVSN